MEPERTASTTAYAICCWTCRFQPRRTGSLPSGRVRLAPAGRAMRPLGRGLATAGSRPSA